MHIFLSCPQCKRQIKIRAEHLGKKLKCPRCAEAAVMPSQPEKKIYVASNCAPAGEMIEKATRALVERGFEVWRTLDLADNPQHATGKEAALPPEFAPERSADIASGLRGARAFVATIGAADFVLASFLEEVRAAASAGTALVVLWAGDPVVFKTSRFADYIDANAPGHVDRLPHALVDALRTSSAADEGAAAYRLGLLLGALRIESLAVALLRESLSLRSERLGADHVETARTRDILRILEKTCEQRLRLVEKKTGAAPKPRYMAPGPAPQPPAPAAAAPSGVAPGGAAAKPKTPVAVDKNVQFTVFRPRAIEPATWNLLLAFAHLAKKRPDAPANELEPTAVVQKQAKAALGEKADQFQKLVQDSLYSVPREGEITFLPEMEGVQFNPPRHSFLWLEPVHKVEFRIKADASLVGETARGRLTVLLGSVILADVPLAIDVEAELPEEPAPREEVSARPYRKIFASYSHKDLAVVEHFEKYLALMGDEVLRDWKHLRTGQKWNERLLQMIEEADVFQLFWSSNSMTSEFCRREWEHALKIAETKDAGASFIRPVYWEKPMPTAPALPPDNLAELHFAHIGIAQKNGSVADPMSESEAEEKPEADSEFELSLGEEESADGDESEEKDAFDTDYDMPVLDESASDVSAPETDRSDFALDDAGVEAEEDDSGSQVEFMDSGDDASAAEEALEGEEEGSDGDVEEAVEDEAFEGEVDEAEGFVEDAVEEDAEEVTEAVDSEEIQEADETVDVEEEAFGSADEVTEDADDYAASEVEEESSAGDRLRGSRSYDTDDEDDDERAAKPRRTASATPRGQESFVLVFLIVLSAVAALVFLLLKWNGNI